MKARTLIVIAAVAAMATGCRFANQVKEMVEDIATLPPTAENVAKRAEALNSNVVLVTSVADTQYALFRQRPPVFKKDSIWRCYAARYVKEGQYVEDSATHWHVRIGQFRLDEPQQPVVLTRTAADALTLTVDSVVIAVTDIVKTDSTLTFGFGFDEPDRQATLHLYGKARAIEEPFAETSIQQMLTLALTLDCLLEDDETTEATDFIESIDTIESIESIESIDSILSLSYAERYAQYSRMDSLAMALGFRDKSTTATNDRLKYEVKGVSRKASKCFAAMEQMGEAAATSGCRVWRVDHTPHHRNCKFTIEWY